MNRILISWKFNLGNQVNTNYKYEYDSKQDLYDELKIDFDQNFEILNRFKTEVKLTLVRDMYYDFIQKNVSQYEKRTYFEQYWQLLFKQV